MEKLMAVLMFIVVLCLSGIFISMNSRIADLEYEILQNEIRHCSEIEELRKNQRVIAQDVVFLENMLNEISEGGK